LTQTYISNGFIDVSTNIVGRENLWIENQQNIGYTSFGLGTLYPSSTMDATNDNPVIRIQNTSLTSNTQNNTNLGTIEFVSPIYRGQTGLGYQSSANMRCENLYDEYNYNGSLVFSAGAGDSNAPGGHTSMVIRGNNGHIGIGTDNPVSSLHIIGNTEIIADDNEEDESIEKYGSIYGFGIMPLGSIIMFHGEIKENNEPDTIDGGQFWRLCNGSTYNGIETPDLRNEFILGANGTGEATGYYKTGDTGGKETVTLDSTQLPSHNHTQASTSGAKHRHVPIVVDGNDYNYSSNYGGPFTMGTDDRMATGGYAAAYYSEDGNALNNSGSHSHSTVSTGGDDEHENRPPFYALAYIMRVY
jgi:microcystin-dependent protein